MKTILAIVAVAVIAICVNREAHAHGIPIGVAVVNNKLTLSQGMVDPVGYAPMIFLNPGEGDDIEDFQMDHIFVPGFGDVGLTNLPGFDIANMNADEELYLNIFPRPVNNAAPNEQRLSWYAMEDVVSVAPHGESLSVVSDFGDVNVPQTATPVPIPLKVTEVDPLDLGNHVHFLRYMLDDNPQASDGTYGFFAYLSSPGYTSSEPMLLIFNNRVNDPDELIRSALAINAAAWLPGDYNHNGRVDGADYVVWRNTLGSTTELAADGSGNKEVDDADYNIWRNNIGAMESAGGASLDQISVPEPLGWMSLAAWLSSCWLTVGGRTRKRPPTFWDRVATSDKTSA